MYNYIKIYQTYYIFHYILPTDFKHNNIVLKDVQCSWNNFIIERNKLNSTVQL